MVIPGMKRKYIKEKSPSVETERPLTIACHMKRVYITVPQAGTYLSALIPNYFLVESFFVESTATLAESTLVESTFTAAESFFVESAVAAGVEPLLQAAKKPATAIIANNFFIL
jgi:hypothetical protein